MPDLAGQGESEQLSDAGDSVTTAQSIVAWQFNTAGQQEGWTHNPGVTNNGVSGGSWNLVMSGFDPSLFGPGISIDASTTPFVEITMSSNDSNVSAQLFWTVSGDASFSEQRSKRFTLNNDGAQHSYLLDFSDDPDWTDTITQLRFDPVSVSHGGSVSIDAIRLLSLDTTTAVGGGGDWHDPGTWDNGVPTLTHNVVIPSGATVQLAGASHEANTLLVEGTLAAVESGAINKSLTSDWILVDGGSLDVGSLANPFDTHSITITLEGDNPTQSLPELGIGSNDAFLITRNGGTLSLFGGTETSWTQLGATASAGASSITLKEAVTWDVGDEIVIASTTFDMNEAESRTITSVSGDQRTLGLNAPLTYSHYGQLQFYDNGKGTNYELDERAEVGLLSRNIKIQGDADATVDGIGGNLMFLETAGAVNIDGVELYHMGQKARLGRYPVHWHRAGDRDGDFISNTSIHRAFNRAVTIHGAHNILVSQTVAYDHIGHGFFLEDAVETGNEFYYNLGLVTREPQPGEELLPSDLGPKQFQISGPGTFWITNPANDYVGNVAAGSQTGSGFWYALPESALGPSASDPQYQSVNPQYTDLGLFLNNRAHSNAVGLDVDGGPDLVTGEPISAHYSPPSTANFASFTAFANSKNGVYYRGTSNIHLTDARLADNVQGTMFAFAQTISDSLIVGVSDNDFGGAKKHGFAVYDGPNIVDNVHFAGFNTPGAGLFTVIGAAERHVNHLFQDITFDDPATPFSFPDTLGNNTIAHHWGFSLYDVDGSLTGTAGQSIIYDHPMMRSDGDIALPSWQKAAVTQRSIGHLRLHYDVQPEDVPKVTITRTDGPGADVSHTDPPVLVQWTQLGAILNTDFVYGFSYNTPVTGNSIEVRLEEVAAGDYVYVHIDNPWEWINVLGATAKGSEQAVRDSDQTAYFTESDGDLLVKVVVPDGAVSGGLSLARSAVPSSVVVDIVLDEMDGDTSLGDISLREAIDLANTRPEIDEITFDPSLDGQTITLLLGMLAVSDSLTIDASSLAAGLTIDASGNDPTPNVDNGDGSLVFFISDIDFLTNIDVELRSLTLTGADAATSGGAIRSADSLTLVDSTVVGNASQGVGGGINVVLRPSATTTIINSTISGNHSALSGGGVWTQMVDAGAVTIISSTITNNTADADASGDGTGGGLFVSGTSGPTLRNTIVAANYAGGANDDASGPIESSSMGNLIGADTGVTGISDGSGGNQIGSVAAPIDPLLAPLADNGGGTLTHALLPGSPAFEGGVPGDVAGVGGVPLYDQRGAVYQRILGATIDAGAFEFEPIAGDGNLDGQVNGLDYLLWATYFGDDPAQDPPGAPMNGDYSNDGRVDGIDYLFWVEIYRMTLQTTLASQNTEPIATLHADELAVVDQVFVETAEAGDSGEVSASVEPRAHDWRIGVAFDAVLDDLAPKPRDREQVQVRPVQEVNRANRPTISAQDNDPAPPKTTIRQLV